MPTKGTWKWMKKNERKNENVKNARKIRQTSWFDDETSPSSFCHPNHLHVIIHKQTTN